MYLKTYSLMVVCQWFYFKTYTSQKIFVLHSKNCFYITTVAPSAGPLVPYPDKASTENDNSCTVAQG